MPHKPGLVYFPENKELTIKDQQEVSNDVKANVKGFPLAKDGTR